MIPLREILQRLEAWAPPHWAESYDTVGLLWGDPYQPVSAILTTLDITPAILEEAQQLGANLIVSHHPIWFGNKTRLNWDTFSDRLIHRLIQAGIAVYAMHTNLDHAQDGVSYVLCQALGVEPQRFLQSQGEYGAGYIGMAPFPIPPEDFLRHLQKTLRVPFLRYAPGHQRAIQRIAVCGGAGSFLLSAAIQAGADAFLTADIPYHRFFEADGRLWLVDIGHYESEIWISDQLARYLKRHFPSLPIYSTRIHTNPIQYWV